MAATRYATYKGRQYRLEYLGSTQYGPRAKLAFLDGSKSFWVPAGAVAETRGAPQTAAVRGSGRRDCCGGPCPVTGQRCTRANPCHDCV